ncbi:MAG: hypothetical protein KOO69_04590 [Victivallales bacterium]|nr:hypothetical protein [Victivallales bacterium]
MKVCDLIKLLEDQPVDMEVVVESYEEGVDPVTELKAISVSDKENREWYEGIYEENTQSKHNVLLIKSKYNRTEAETDQVGDQVSDQVERGKS